MIYKTKTKECSQIKKMRNKVIIVILVMLSIAIYLFFFNNPSINDVKKVVSPTASLYDNPKYIGDKLKFIDDNKQEIDISQIDNKWLLLYFGYASCPDVCPIDLAIISKVIDNMYFKEKIQAIFISIDPKRDIGNMNDFAKKFNKKFIGTTLKDDDLIKLTKSLGVYSEVVKRKQEINMDHSSHNYHHNYLIDHTASYILLNQDKELVALFTNPHIEDKITNAVDIIIKNL